MVSGTVQAPFRCFVFVVSLMFEEWVKRWLRLYFYIAFDALKVKDEALWDLVL